ncbi:hypothetical protein [Armatimonas rosea]|uniref:Uncharacterized protein n=1 Tax=Armatimonas rosea TaxID=685828 RepID=A0A7W9SRT7_ARMRO|nr:hypothetical protein [Armatimonas rosea]MBB6050893.1 hypothetical protein [Armatimonas rosea]
MNEGVLGEPRAQDIRLYRKAAIAVVSTYLGLDEAFVEAVLLDQMDEYLEALAEVRERLKAEHYDDYLSLLAREVIVRYAATAAEGLAADPESPLARRRIMGDTGGFGFNDDVNAVVRLHEIFELLESPYAESEAEAILVTTKRQMCNYYNSVAYHLVRGPLLPVIIEVAEEYVHDDQLSAARVRELVIAAQ